MAAISIRLLNAADVPQCLELSSEAGWNQTAEDWALLLELAAGCCFGVDREGELAATATLMCYGNELAWLGMVLTRMKFRRRGLGRLLVQHALSVADGRAISTLGLDATTLGLPLYESFGFVREQEIERWSGHGSQSAGVTKDVRPPDWDMLAAEKRPIREALARRGKFFGNNHEFAMQRSGSRATYLGPCHAHSETRAGQLIAAALGVAGGPWFWDLLPANQHAVALAQSLGFCCDRKLVRMRRGKETCEDQSSVYAIAGFEFG